MRNERLVAWLSAVLLAVSHGSAWSEEPSKDAVIAVQTLLQPFWASDTMKGETLFFCERKAGEAPAAALLFLPDKVLAVRSATGAVVYEEGRDYTLDKTAGLVRLAAGSRIPFKKLEEMYPPADSKLPKYAHKRGDPKTHLIFGEGHFFHDLQVEISYTHAAGAWKGPVPAFAGAQLPNTIKKLRAREPLTVCLSGDSISQGYNASGFTKAPPHQPPYGQLVALGLEQVWGSKVALHNFAIAGWTSQQGVADAGKVAAQKPDLVLIAYGMNDSGGRGAAEYAANLKAIMDKVRAASPSAEFVLISSMLPNAEWHYPKLERFSEYQQALKGLCGSGVVLADVTAMWTELLKRKAHHDLTGNGLNHPNDFGHRLYAQTILALLAEPAARR